MLCFFGQGFVLKGRSFLCLRRGVLDCFAVLAMTLRVFCMVLYFEHVGGEKGGFFAGRYSALFEFLQG